MWNWSKLLIKAIDQANFLEVLIEKINNIGSINIKIYISGDFSIDLCLNESYIFFKKIFQKTNQFQVPSKAIMNFEIIKLTSINKRFGTCEM